MAKVKVFDHKRTNGQTDKQTDMTKTICPRITDSGGIKIELFHYFRDITNKVQEETMF